MSFFVDRFYRFVSVANPQKVKEALMTLGGYGLCGTVIVAEEGINGTVSGPCAVRPQLVQLLREYGIELPAVHQDVDVIPFQRLFVRIKSEIVTMGMPAIDPNVQRGRYVLPEQWNELITDPEIIVVDTRNDFEVKLGTFQGAENPDTRSFRAFPEWVDQNLERLAEAKGVAMFCTGGIRCEKATSYLSTKGLDTTFHLKGGILDYLEQIEPDSSLFQGDCFVFDDRVAVGHSGEPVQGVSICFGCRRAIKDDEKAHPHYEEGVSCVSCFHETSEAQKQKYRSRHQQKLNEMTAKGK